MKLKTQKLKKTHDLKKANLKKSWEKIKLDLERIEVFKNMLPIIFKNQLNEKKAHNKKQKERIQVLSDFLQIVSIQNSLSEIQKENQRKIELIVNKIEISKNQINICPTENFISDGCNQNLKEHVFPRNNLMSEYKIEKQFLVDFHFKNTLTEDSEVNLIHQKKEFYHRIDSCQVCNCDQSYPDNAIVFCSVELLGL